MSLELSNSISNHWILLIYGTLILLFVIITLKHLRYDFGREVILNLFCILQGRKYKWVREPGLARRVLSSSPTKGCGIEELLSIQALKPIVSLESVSGQRWTRMKDNFLILKSHLPPLDQLGLITEEQTQELIKNPNVSIIDSSILAKLIVQIMQIWLFGTGTNEVNVDPKVLLSIEEWRKEIAIKGKGDRKLKMHAAFWIQKLIVSSKYWDIFGDKWYLDEYWSLILQPFFVSPVINITDLAVTLSSQNFKEDLNRGLNTNIDYNKKSDMEQVIISAINYRHPFPILERWFPNGLKESENSSTWLIEPNTHVFVPVDQIGQTIFHLPPSQSLWSAFGAGKRACGGRDIGLTLCTKMFSLLLSIKEKEDEEETPSFRPWEGHNYSGRDNDLKETWSQSFYQIKILTHIIWKLVFSQKSEKV